MRPGAPGTDLVLVATPFERRQLDERGGFPGCRTEICGFGPVSAAAHAARLVTLLSPRRVLLVGIAGTFAPARAEVGSACTFARVRLDGVGVGSGPGFTPPSQIGLPQWEGGAGERIEETLEIAGGGTGELLTVCAASASPEEAAARSRRYPEAVAEDMEGFAVALACRRSDVPVAVVRGISNVAGDRAAKRWRWEEALAACRDALDVWIARQVAQDGGRERRRATRRSEGRR